MRKELNDEQIIKLIYEYIENENAEYAIMIDGEWGSGKTCFVTEKLKENLKERFKKNNKKIKFIYISAYGVKESKELDDKIYEKVIEEFFPEKIKKLINDVENGVESLYKILKEFIKKLPDIDKNSMRRLIEILQKRHEKEYILIFDDLERTEMPISEILGYINEFVEHRKMKTIIIANEKELLKKKIYSNNELKYIVAESESLNIPVEEVEWKSLYRNQKEEKNSSKISIEDLNNRVEKIFGEDLLYNQIKEKLVGITIHYYPNMNAVIEVLIDNIIKEDNVKVYVRAKSDRIINIMQSEGHINIRTLKFALQIIQQVLDIVFNMDLSDFEKDTVEDCKSELITYIVYTCISYKDGTYKSKDNSEFFSIDISNRLKSGKYGFKFVDDVIEKGYLKSERVEEVIIAYLKFKSEDSNAYNDPINKLKSYWEMEDKEIEECYEQLIRKLKKNQYKPSSYCKIIYILIKIVKIGFPSEYLEEIINIMLDNIEKMEELEEFYCLDEVEFSFDDSDEKEYYYKKIAPIKESLDKLNKSGRIMNFNSIITGEKGWGEEFSSYCLNKKGDFIARKEFFALIDIDNLLNIIKISNTKEISDFRRCVATIYGMREVKQYFKNDLGKLVDFIDGLYKIDKKEIDSYDKTKRFNINWLKQNINLVIEKINSSI